MGTHFCSTVNRQKPQVGPPKNAQNHLKYIVLDVSWSLIGAERCARHAAWEHPAKTQKTSAALHGNAFLFNSQPSINRQTSQVGLPKNAQNHLKYTVLDVSWSLIGVERRARQKNGPAQEDAKELPRRSQKTFIFQPLFANVVLRDPLGGRSRCVLHFEHKQKGIGFIDVSDTIAEAMLDHPKGHPKLKNEYRAAWERSVEKKNERHAAWERFLHVHGPDWSPKMGPKKMLQTI